ncbi:hypothetical protein NE237_012815 [Protea cynaroides]|uniref:Uncharacterized protein n=1 Tax=Protea cynaroides TaxID=273540 RepID=A0A9Q0GXH4_9MAGN|nr:hypothetical protein NE237_012815 [Protea cynaroides]
MLTVRPRRQISDDDAMVRESFIDTGNVEDQQGQSSHEATVTDITGNVGNQEGESISHDKATVTVGNQEGEFMAIETEVGEEREDRNEEEFEKKGLTKAFLKPFG